MEKENNESPGKRLAEFLEERGERAYRVAFRLCRNHDEAKDLVQETCYRALRKWSLYDPAKGFEAWFLTVLRHEFIDRWRGAQWRHHSLDLLIEKDDGLLPYQEIITSVERPVLEMLVHEERRGLVRETFLALKRKDREVLALRDIGGLQYDDVAEKIGIPTGAVRTRIFRARQRLRNAFFERYPELSPRRRRGGA